MKIPLFEASYYPIFQNIVYDSIEEAFLCCKDDIRLVQDSISGLVYNDKFDANKMKYTSNYHNEQEFSPTFKKHLQDVLNIIEKNIGYNNLLEIGCGNGYFLEYLSQNNFEIEGMDPSYEGANQKIKNEYYTPNSNKKFDGIILRHVLEHIKSPFEFLDIIKKANNNKGLIYIEVPCLDWINENCAFTDIFYEHVNYFRIIDFKNMFSEIIDIGHVFNGQYIYSC